MATKKNQIKSGSKILAEKKRQEAVADLLKEAEFLDRQAEEEYLHNPPPKFGVLSHEPESELGQRLQYAREAKNLTQGQLSDLTKRADSAGKGLSRAVISLYELGTNRPGPKEMRLLCEVLRITPSHLIYGKDDPFDKRFESDRYHGFAHSKPEFYASLCYCFSRLYSHQRVAMMDIMMGLLRGWNKGFDKDLDSEANGRFLEAADELRVLLAKRKKASGED